MVTKLYFDELRGDLMVEHKYARGVYEYLHTIPELGFCEIKTSKFLADELRKFGYTVTERIGTTTVMGRLKGKLPGTVFALRADMDALEFEFGGEKKYIHACGHDAHCAMVLEAAKYAAENGVKRGEFVVIFQQAEEIRGSIEGIETGSFDDVEEIVGLHLRPSSDAKLGEASASLIHCSSYIVEVRILGKTAHGSRPHLGTNVIEVACGIVNQVGHIHEDPLSSYSIKATKIATVGNSSNSIPDLVDITFDLRAQDNEIMNRLLEKLEKIIMNTVSSYDGKVDFIKKSGTFAPEYDEILTNEVRESIIATLGSCLEDINTTAGEDFHHYTKMIGCKSAYIGLGADLFGGLHLPNMGFDIRTLDYGVAIFEEILRKKVL